MKRRSGVGFGRFKFSERVEGEDRPGSVEEDEGESPLGSLLRIDFTVRGSIVRHVGGKNCLKSGVTGVK
jgi:hypothetical protein